MPETEPVLPRQEISLVFITNHCFGFLVFWFFEFTGLRKKQPVDDISNLNSHRLFRFFIMRFQCKQCFFDIVSKVKLSFGLGKSGGFPVEGLRLVGFHTYLNELYNFGPFLQYKVNLLLLCCLEIVDLLLSPQKLKKDDVFQVLRITAADPERQSV
jgi:hypothetical protein